jgi:hypothetical protein
VNTIKREQLITTGILALAMAVPGIALTLVQRPAFAAFGLAFLILGGVSGIRAMFGGLLLYILGGANPLQHPDRGYSEEPASEAGMKNLKRRKRGNFIWAGISFASLIISLSLTVIANQAGDAALLGASAGSSIGMAAIHVHALYFGIKSDQAIGGKL